MRPIMLISLFALSGLAACVDTRLPVTNGPITSAAEFDATAAGYYYATENFGISINRSGSYTGERAGEQFSGSWVFEDGKLCLTQSEPAELPTNCQFWAVKGNAFRIGDSRGATTYVYRYPLPLSYEERIGLKS